MPGITNSTGLVVLVMVVSLYIQSITGFAFTLVFLGFVGVFSLMPISVAADAATLIALIQTFFYFRQEGLGEEWKVARPAMVAAVPGVAAGLTLLYWLGESHVTVLQGLLGGVITLAALLMLVDVRQRTNPSGVFAYRIAGLLSGVLGGLFSAAGPPIVYLLYRQPVPMRVVRHSLFAVFGIIQLMRLIYVIAAGQIESLSFAFAALSIPLALLVLRGSRRFPLPLPPSAIKRAAALLMAATGVGLVLRTLLG